MSAHDPPCPAVLQGWGKKKGRVRRNWKRRWLVLSSAKLEYYERNEKKAVRFLKGAIPLDLVISVSRYDGNKKRKHCISMSTVQRVYFIALSNGEERELWLNTINQLLRSNESAPASSTASREEEFHDVSLA
ncbi:MAG: PH domain-containing protein [archaeon]|nr:PH domain-containing protein [archaeon]